MLLIGWVVCREHALVQLITQRLQKGAMHLPIEVETAEPSGIDPFLVDWSVFILSQWTGIALLPA